MTWVKLPLVEVDPPFVGWYGSRALSYHTDEYIDIGGSGGNAVAWPTTVSAGFGGTGFSDSINAFNASSSSFHTVVNFATMGAAEAHSFTGFSTSRRYAASAGNGLYGIAAGGSTLSSGGSEDPSYSTMNICNCATLTGGEFIGDLTSAAGGPRYAKSSNNNDTYAFFNGGYRRFAGGTAAIAVVNFETYGDATSHGNSTKERRWAQGAGDNSRCVILSGYNLAQFGASFNDTEYFSPVSPANATGWTNLNSQRSGLGAAGDGDKIVAMGGSNAHGSGFTTYSTIDRISIQTSAAAEDFGDLSSPHWKYGCSSGNPA